MDPQLSLADVSKEFAAATGDLDALLDLAARRLSEVVGDLAVIRTLDASGASFETSASVHHPDPVIVDAARTAFRNVPHPVSEGISGKVATTRQSLLIPAFPQEEIPKQTLPGWVAFLEEIAITSLMGVPLIAQNRVLGVVIMIRGGASGPYSQSDLRLVEDLAGHAALAIANATLLRESRSLAERLRLELDSHTRTEVALRTTENQLRQAQKMEAIGRLAGGVAHDFNNLLSIILSYAGMIVEELPPGSSLRDDVEEIRQAGKRAADLTRQLLAFSRQQVVEPTLVDLNEHITSMDRMIRRLIGEDVELHTVPSGALDPVFADPGQIEQVLLNLVVNARDAMPNGGKLVIETGNTQLDEEYARAHEGVTPGPHVMLAVSDTGSGMDKATQERIFEPFFTTKELGKGTGLGLSTVYGIVKQSRGSIWVYSEVGRGTTFKVYFPRAAAGDAGRPREQPGPIASVRGTETILLVEDEPALRAVARVILEKNGYRILEAANAADAEELSAKSGAERIHLLLTDVVMPDASGSDLAARLAPRRPEMRVLYMSGYTQDTITRSRVLAPGVALLQKPLTPDALLRRVREVLDASPGAR